MNIEEYCAEIKNYFVINPDKDINFGTFEIADTTITLPFISENQYFRIVGSKFNDGVYKYDNRLQLVDETFIGAIWAMSVPKGFINAVSLADSYLENHPFARDIQSESFGGYSYTRGGSSLNTGFGYLPEHISKALNRYRKLRAI